MDTSDIQGKQEQPQAYSPHYYCWKIVGHDCYKVGQLFLLKNQGNFITKQGSCYKTGQLLQNKA